MSGISYSTEGQMFAVPFLSREHHQQARTAMRPLSRFHLEATGDSLSLSFVFRECRQAFTPFTIMGCAVVGMQNASSASLFFDRLVGGGQFH